MSCSHACDDAKRRLPTTLIGVLGDEGFRLFIPLAAVYAALFPSLWVLAWGFDLPLARTVPPALWHAHEMIVGAFGAALIGFLTTAAPEWTDTQPPRGRVLWALAGLWGIGRLVGLLGWDGLSAVGALVDFSWMAALIVWVLWLSWQRRSDRLIVFAFWGSILVGCVAVGRVGFILGDIELATKAIHLAGFAFLGLLGLTLTRVTVPVTNLVLDPSERTSPYRPHPGRMHLAPGLVLIAMVGDAVGLSPAVSGYLIIAAGAAFMDRVSEAFIGREAARAEIMMLAGSSALAGIGLMMAGAARLDTPWPEVTGLHIAFMGGLGLGVYTIFSIVGLMHTNRPLGLSRRTRIGALVLVGSVMLRVLPDMGIDVPGPLHGIAAVLWAGAFLLLLHTYWPALSGAGDTDERG